MTTIRPGPLQGILERLDDDGHRWHLMTASLPLGLNGSKDEGTSTNIRPILRVRGGELAKADSGQHTERVLERLRVRVEGHRGLASMERCRTGFHNYWTENRTTWSDVAHYSTFTAIPY